MSNISYLLMMVANGVCRTLLYDLTVMVGERS